MKKEASSNSTPKIKYALAEKYQEQADKKHQQELDGPDIYNDKEKFPEGPWCKKGDWVIFARYAGSRIQIDGGEVRLLNDDEVLATIDNPEDILHQY
jgi:co-chaperonin GroES (HSP10)